MLFERVSKIASELGRREAGGVERDGVGWWSRGEEVKKGEGRAEEQAGNAHTTSMLCACVHHGLCYLRIGTHKSQKSHQRQDYQFNQKNKLWGKLEEFVVSEHEGAILCHCMFFYEETAPALLERCTAGRQRAAFWKHSAADLVLPLTVPPP